MADFQQDIKALMDSQAKACEEKFVLEKVYWQRTVKMITVIVSILLGISGGAIAWGFSTSAAVTNNTSGRRDLERRIDVVERQNAIILQSHASLAENQEKVIGYQERLIKKLDILIDRSGGKALDE